MTITKLFYLPYILLCYLLIQSAPLAYALDVDNYKMEYLNIKAGLSGNMVSKVISDAKGVKWFAGNVGLNRYDGKNFKHLKPSQRYSELVSENIETIYLSKSGNIWVGTKSGGLSMYDIQKDVFTNYNHIIKDTNKNRPLRVISILEDKQGYIWIGTWGAGVYVFDYANSKVVKHFSTRHVIQGIVEDNDGDVWFAGNQSIYYYNPTTDKIKEIRSKQLNMAGWIMELFYDNHKQKLYVGGGKGIVSFDLKTKEFQHIFDNKNPQKLVQINALNMDDQGRLWAGSWKNGLYVSNPALNSFTKLDLLPVSEVNNNYETVTDIHIDTHNFIWVATSFGGVVKLSPQHSFKKIANTPKKWVGLNNNNITAIARDANKALWCGLNRGGIAYSKDGKQFESLPFFKEETCGAFLFYNRKVYFCANKSLYMASIDKPFAPPVKMLSSPLLNKVKKLYLDKQLNLWVGTQQNGLLSIDLKGDLGKKDIRIFNTNKKGKNYLGSNRVESIFEDKNGTLWIGSYYGFYKFENQSFVNQNIKERFNFPSNIFLSGIASSKADKLWIGGSGGILELQIHADSLSLLHYYSKSQNIESDYITSLALDNADRLWVGHNKGLSMIPINDRKVYNFNAKIGVDISSVNTLSSQQDIIYMGGQDGIVFFKPDMVKITSSRPSVIFTNLKIDNVDIKVGDNIHDNVVLKNEISYTKHIDLSYQDKVVIFSLVVDDYLDYQNVEFYYRILGVSDKWMSNGNLNEVGVSQLSGGNYTLEVKATRDGENFGSVNAISIYVRPPWWDTKLFKGSVLMLLIATSIFIYKYRTYKLKKRQKELEYIVDQKTLEIRTQNEELLQQSEELQQQRDYLYSANVDISQKNELITLSLNYAKTIQQAILPTVENWREVCSEHFVIYQPKDIVSGDFYWLAKEGNKVVVACVDCTGHGVPGALMSMIGNSALNQIVKEKKEFEPERILSLLDYKIKTVLKQEKGNNDDGMDLAVGLIETINGKTKLTFSGAKSNLLYYAQAEHKLTLYKGSRKAIGGKISSQNEFQSQSLMLSKGDGLYFFTDGVIDVCNSERKKFGRKRFLKLIEDNMMMGMKQQEQTIASVLNDFQGGEPQRDDITILGIRV